jgi:hypothetical protein
MLAYPGAHVEQVYGGAAAEREAKHVAASAKRAGEQGRAVYVSRCRCEGTLEHRVFDKHADPLDGCVRVRQLEALLRDVHAEAERAKQEQGQEHAAAGRKKSAKVAEFDDQDAREAEDQLGVLVNGAPPPEDDEEAMAEYDPLAGEGPIDFLMFKDWKAKFEEQKKERSNLGGAGGDDDDDADGEGD